MAKRHRALVVQGGGMRGAYAAGAIVELYNLEEKFDSVWATSSGAASCAYAIAGQPEGIEIWKQYLDGRKLVHPLRVLYGRAALDLRYLIDEVFGRRLPLALEKVQTSKIPLIVPVTNVDSGQVEYFDLRHHAPLEVLRAAMSLPGAVLEPVEINGQRYVDGGVIDQFPIEKALEAGAKDVVVVMTRPPAYVAKPTGRLGVWLASRKFPAIRDAVSRRHEYYARAVGLMEKPPSGVKVEVIRPTAALPVGRWTTKRRKLLAAIERGVEDTKSWWSGRARDPTALQAR